MWLIPRWVVDLWVVAEDILVEIIVLLYGMLFNMGCEVPCKHCCSLWVTMDLEAQILAFMDSTVDLNE